MPGLPEREEVYFSGEISSGAEPEIEIRLPVCPLSR
jgi:hypothetical protein